LGTLGGDPLRPRPRLTGALLAGAVLLAACGGSGGTGDALPSVEVQTLRGAEPFDLADLEGPAVVNLWATWCAPCRRELPAFEAVSREVAGEVAFVGVNIGDTADDAAEYLDELGITYDQYLDIDGELTAALETATLPVTLIVDGDERVTVRHIGPLEEDELTEQLEQVRPAPGGSG
jgi:thiol-disulfide isomerase/thioredoxin